jgi:hypothetical protein
MFAKLALEVNFCCSILFIMSIISYITVYQENVRTSLPVRAICKNRYNPKLLLSLIQVQGYSKQLC